MEYPKACHFATLSEWRAARQSHLNLKALVREFVEECELYLEAIDFAIAENDKKHKAGTFMGKTNKAEFKHYTAMAKAKPEKVKMTKTERREEEEERPLSVDEQQQLDAHMEKREATRHLRDRVPQKEMPPWEMNAWIAAYKHTMSRFYLKRAERKQENGKSDRTNHTLTCDEMRTIWKEAVQGFEGAPSWEYMDWKARVGAAAPPPLPIPSESIPSSLTLSSPTQASPSRKKARGMQKKAARRGQHPSRSTTF